MDNKAISKMNKKELYEKCQKQEQEIQKLSLFQDYHEDIINDYDDDSDNLLEKIRILKVKNASYADMYKNVDNKLKKDNEKLRKALPAFSKENKKLKLKIESMTSEQANSDCAKYIEELQEDNKVLQMKYDKLYELF